MGEQPGHVGLAGVNLGRTVAMFVLAGELCSEPTEPEVVLERTADPFATWMVSVRGLVTGLFGSHCKRCVRKIRRFLARHGGKDPMGRVEELTGFKDHLDDMFVAMPFGALTGIRMEEEDIHGWLLKEGRDSSPP